MIQVPPMPRTRPECVTPRQRLLRKMTAPLNDRQQSVLILDCLRARRDIEIPKITAAAIEDRSKGDSLLKIIGVLQTTWFSVQCIALYRQRLALTKSKIVTLALVCLKRDLVAKVTRDARIRSTGAQVGASCAIPCCED